MEILHQTEPHNSGCANSDIAVAAKVAINLKREEHRRQQYTGAIVLAYVVEHGIDILGKDIGHT